ncbi:MAG: class I SAM-dependent methyltransferase [Candidatus Spechtbacterales bacterium]
MNFLDPREAVKEFGLKEGMTVADFGSGAGHFVLALAPLVGRGGVVYAVDIREEVLEVTRGSALMQGVLQVRVVRGDLELPGGSTLAQDSVDVVLCSNILHQVEDASVVMAEAKRVLKPHGSLIVLEWDNTSPMAPEGAIGKEEMQTLAAGAGFVPQRQIDTGEFHYGLVFAVKE